MSGPAAGRSAPIETKFSGADLERGVLKGYGAVFGNVDSYGDVITPGAFRATLQGKSTLPMFWNHDPGQVIGLWTRLAEDGHGLLVEGQLNMGVAKAREVRALALQHAAGGLSIGFVARSWRPGKAPVKRYLDAIDLVETSVTALPANPKARITEAKGDAPATIRHFESGLRELLGLTRRQARLVAAAGWPAIGRRDAGDQEALRELARELKARATTLRTVSEP